MLADYSVFMVLVLVNEIYSFSINLQNTVVLLGETVLLFAEELLSFQNSGT